MNVLKLGFVPFEFNGHHTMIGEFFIDDKPLIEWFGEIRHLGNCDTNLTGDLKLVQNSIMQLTGDIVPDNAFSTKRFVLYRCHCGCDDCGIISCEIVVNDKTVTWKNITVEEYESMGITYDDDGNPFDAIRLDFEFDKTAYLAEIQRFMAKINL